MKVNDGILKFINMESGHYLPSRNFAIQALNLLGEMGADLSHDTKIEFYHDSSLHEMRVQTFLQQGNNVFNSGGENFSSPENLAIYSILRGMK